jgi:hypothetical protein
MEKILPTMVKKTMDHHVLPNLTSTTIMYASFDLWMFGNNVNFFAMVINLLNDTQVPIHDTLGLFEVNEIIG